MNKTLDKNVVFLMGPEVEHTPAYSKKTLFVVGKPGVDQILQVARENKTPHIRLGFDRSFTVNSVDETGYWDKTLTRLLDTGFWVTLEYPADNHEDVRQMLNAGIWQSRIFVPLLSYKVPSVSSSSPNLTIKLDDSKFGGTNPGVWCMHHTAVTDSNRFTDWQDYDAVVVGDDPGIDSVEVPVAVVLTPKVEEVAAEELVEESVEEAKVKNQTELGLDINPTTALKPDTEEDDEYTKKLKGTPVVNSVDEAAALYAANTTTDSLGKDAPKKTKVTKKAEA
jgi:hypothetical protein